MLPNQPKKERVSNPTPYPSTHVMTAAMFFWRIDHDVDGRSRKEEEEEEEEFIQNRTRAGEEQFIRNQEEEENHWECHQEKEKKVRLMSCGEVLSR